MSACADRYASANGLAFFLSRAVPRVSPSPGIVSWVGSVLPGLEEILGIDEGAGVRAEIDNGEGVRAIGVGVSGNNELGERNDEVEKLELENVREQ